MAIFQLAILVRSWTCLERWFGDRFGLQRPLDQLDPQFRLFEQMLAPQTQTRSQLEAIERLIEREIAAIEQLHDRLQTGHGIFEGAIGACLLPEFDRSGEISAHAGFEMPRFVDA